MNTSYNRTPWPSFESEFPGTEFSFSTLISIVYPNRCTNKWVLPPLSSTVYVPKSIDWEVVHSVRVWYACVCLVYDYAICSCNISNWIIITMSLTISVSDPCTMCTHKNHSYIRNVTNPNIFWELRSVKRGLTVFFLSCVQFWIWILYIFWIWITLGITSIYNKCSWIPDYKHILNMNYKHILFTYCIHTLNMNYTHSVCILYTYSDQFLILNMTYIHIPRILHTYSAGSCHDNRMMSL